MTPGRGEMTASCLEPRNAGGKGNRDATGKLTRYLGSRLGARRWLDILARFIPVGPGEGHPKAPS